MATKVVTGKVRLSYANIFKSRAAFDGGTEKYSVCVLVDKNDKTTLKKINAAIEDAIQQGISEKWGGKRPANLKLPLRDGAERDNPEYEGAMFFNASSNNKPGVVDKDLNEIIDPEEVYSGCYGRVSVNFYPFNTNGNKGVACGLNNVQKLADGERLGGSRAKAEDDFNDGFEDEEEF